MLIAAREHSAAKSQPNLVGTLSTLPRRSNAEAEASQMLQQSNNPIIHQSLNPKRRTQSPSFHFHVSGLLSTYAQLIRQVYENKDYSICFADWHFAASPELCQRGGCDHYLDGQCRLCLVAFAAGSALWRRKRLGLPQENAWTPKALPLDSFEKPSSALIYSDSTGVQRKDAEQRSRNQNRNLPQKNTKNTQSF